MLIGRVKFFKISKNGKPYGFIHADDGEDYYFNLGGLKDQHRNQLPRYGDRARFKAENNPRGLRATEVEILV